MRYDLTNGWEANETLRNDGNNIGIGIPASTVLEEKLEVEGGIKIGSSIDTNLSKPGNIQFNETNSNNIVDNVTFLINGTIWQGINGTDSVDYWNFT